MFSESAELYDLIYSSFRDYAREARDIAALLRQAHPQCRTILDVACGTAEHAHRLATDHGFEVDGCDLDPAFVRIARAKHAAGHFYQANMIDFHLGRRYDAVVCLGSSIGYVRTLPNVRHTLACFREHLAGDGVVIVEPWLAPDALEPGYTNSRTAEAHGNRVVRVSHTAIEGRLSRLRFDYEIHDRDGVRHATEVHELGLFTTGEMLQSFAEAGLVVQHDAVGLTGRGLYVGQPR